MRADLRPSLWLHRATQPSSCGWCGVSPAGLSLGTTPAAAGENSPTYRRDISPLRKHSTETAKWRGEKEGSAHLSPPLRRSLIRAYAAATEHSRSEWVPARGTACSTEEHGRPPRENSTLNARQRKATKSGDETRQPASHNRGRKYMMREQTRKHVR
jgi:hypothetical protein